MKKPKRQFIAWFTGFWEGEGCLYLHDARHRGIQYPRLSVAQTGPRGKQICEQIKGEWGCGFVRETLLKNEKHATLYTWTASKLSEVVRIGKLMLPYMKFRQEEFVRKLEIVRENYEASCLWNDGSDLRLRKLTETGKTTEQICVLLKRTRSSINHRRNRLHIYIVGPRPEGKAPPWTKEELAILEEGHGKKSISGIANEVNRTYSGVAHKASRLKLSYRRQHENRRYSNGL